MAFKASKITRIANLLNLTNSTDPTPGLFYYDALGAGDTFATLMGAGYFNAKTDLGLGSIIDVLAADGRHSIKVTSAMGAAVVTVVSVSIADKTARGQSITATASDTIVTGLGSALAVVVVSEDDAPVIGAEWTSATIGDQAGAPAAGSFLLKTWKPTAVNDATPIAATVFGKKVNWIAIAA